MTREGLVDDLGAEILVEQEISRKLEFLNPLKEKFKFVMIDEFQDASFLERKILNYLTPDCFVCV